MEYKIFINKKQTANTFWPIMIGDSICFCIVDFSSADMDSDINEFLTEEGYYPV